MIKKLCNKILFNLIKDSSLHLRYLLLGLFLMTTFSVRSQNIAINSTGTAPSGSAVLDLSSNTGGGFLLPYMSTGKMNSLVSPTNGLLIYDYTAGCIMGYYASASQWQTLFCPCTGAPTQPDEPTGTTAVCQSSTYTYSVGRVNAPSYIWEVNPYAAGGPTFSGSGTNTQTCPDTAVTINWGTVPGLYDVTVLATDACAEQYAAAPVLQVTVLPTPVAPTVTGNATIVANSTLNYYSVPPVLAATYAWSVSSALLGTITSVTNTNTVTLTAHNVNGGPYNVTCVETSCGTPVTGSLAVTIAACPYACCGGHTTTFTTPGLNSFTVPCNITSVTIDMAGAAGGEGYGCSPVAPHTCVDPVYPGDSAADHPGHGARVQATVAVTPGQILYCYVGAQGTNANVIGADGEGFSYLCAPGGVGGNNDENGGNGFSSQLTPYSSTLGVGSGGGGGGASCIRASTANVFADDILSAAGGGGVGVDDDFDHATELGLGGNGGGSGSVPTAGGWYQSAVEAGTAGGAAAGGASASTTCGGVPVVGCQGSSNGGQNQAAGGGGTTDGDGGDGGMTSICLDGFYGGGGGGGGGHYAGGGGCGGGGGGGYSYTGGFGANTTSAVTVTAGYTTRNGYIKITW